MVWQSPSWLSGINQESVSETKHLISSRNVHVVVSHEGGAINTMSQYGYKRGGGTQALFEMCQY